MEERKREITQVEYCRKIKKTQKSRSDVSAIGEKGAPTATRDSNLLVDSATGDPLRSVVEAELQKDSEHKRCATLLELSWDLTNNRMLLEVGHVATS